MLMQKKYWLFILQLEQDKYYVGVTARDVSKRVSKHQHGFMGVKRTKHYKPLKILDKKNLGVITFDSTEKYETRVTIKYIKRYGVNNVRDGLLTYEANYTYRFGRYFKDDDYSSLLGISTMALSILALSILYILKTYSN